MKLLINIKRAINDDLIDLKQGHEEVKNVIKKFLNIPIDREEDFC